MWYQGTDTANIIRIGYATSPDGITWTKSASYVLDVGATGTWDYKLIQAPSVMFDGASGKYRMWYTGSNVTVLRTGYAESADGITWTKSASYVLDVGPSGAWDDKRVVFARVHYDYSYSCACMLYHMWYSGDASTGNYSYEIGYAYSLDGLTWTKDVDNPIFSVNPTPTTNFDAYMVYASDVIAFEEWGYAMFYTGGTGTTPNGPYSIGMAVSSTPDLIEP